MKAVTWFIAGTSIFLTSTLCFSQVHEPARMLAKKTEQGNQQATLSERRNDIKKQFKGAYEKKGKPKIAIFWNRKFDDQLSQWYQVARASQSGEVSIKGADNFAPQSGDKPAYKQNQSANGKVVASQYAEVRAAKQNRSGFNESEGFEFASGLTSTFISVPTKIIDRDAIMRLGQRDTTKEAGAEIITDYQVVETDALIGYADYLAEILLSPDPEGDVGWSFMVTVKSVNDGSVVAMFKSTANNPYETEPKERWIATSDGFKKATDEREIGTPTQVGEQLAYEMMQALANIWK